MSKPSVQHYRMVRVQPCGREDRLTICPKVAAMGSNALKGSLAGESSVSPVGTKVRLYKGNTLLQELIGLRK